MTEQRSSLPESVVSPTPASTKIETYCDRHVKGLEYWRDREIEIAVSQSDSISRTDPKYLHESVVERLQRTAGSIAGITDEIDKYKTAIGMTVEDHPKTTVYVGMVEGHQVVMVHRKTTGKLSARMDGCELSKKVARNLYDTYAGLARDNAKERAELIQGSFPTLLQRPLRWKK